MKATGLVVLIVTWLGTGALAQTTIVVPNNADLAPYIAAASPGDTLVLAAKHPCFTLNKGLQLVGNGTVIDPVAPAITTLQIPPGQRARLSGLQFPFGIDWGISIWGSNMQIHGDVVLENCSLDTMNGAMTVTGGTVLLRGCQLYAHAGGDPLLLTGGFCSVVDTTAIGNHGLQVYMQGSHDASPGIRQTGGVLWVSHSTLRGGDIGYLYGQPVLNGKPALLVAGGTAFVVDSTLTGGLAPSSWGSRSRPSRRSRPRDWCTTRAATSSVAPVLLPARRPAAMRSWIPTCWGSRPAAR